MKTVYLDMQDTLSDDFRFFTQEVVQKKPFILIVTAEWCGHCQHFKSEALKKALVKVKARSNKPRRTTKAKVVGSKSNSAVADVYVAHFSDVTMRDVINTQSSKLDLVKELLGEVSGYPTITSVSSRHGGKMGVIHYEGERTGDAFAQFITETSKY